MNFVEVDLSKIIIDEKRHDQVIVLKEKKGERQLPIMIGLMEASSIKMKLSDYKMPRPLTHDLVLSIVEGLDAKIERLVIDKLIDQTFHAKLILRTEKGDPRKIDTRPSDGVAIAVRAQIPVFVEEEILNNAEIPKL
ncbi:MAG: bifunctional nuclease family protein [Candidatus Aceula meridiana]|nr:bifunctional nuclease family protein [Candidatus Aceula meridiana]